MKFSDIIQVLSEKYQLISHQELSDVQIFSIAPLSVHSQIKDDTLYFTDSLCTMNIEELHGNFVWCGHISEQLQSFNANWIQVREEDFDAVIEEINAILLFEYKSQNLRLHMINTLISGKGLTALVDVAAKNLNTTIVVIDMSGKIIARSTMFKIDDPLWLESIAQGFCPPLFIEYLHDTRKKHPVAQEGQTILSHCPDSDVYYLAKRLYISGELFGYVFLLQMNDNFSLFSKEALNIISQAVLDQHLKSEGIESAKTAFYGNLLIDIFRGVSTEQIKARIRAGEMKFPRRMCLAAIKPRYFQGDNYIREKLSKMLKQLFPKDLQIYYKKMIIIIFNASLSLSEVYEEYVGKLHAVTSQEHLIVGISNPFSKVTSMKHYYAQAIRAIEISGKLDLQGDIHFYKDIALYDLIKNGSENSNVGFYCHPALSILREHDSENGSQLHDTLKSLTQNGFNNKATAQELFLHRNTLAYRKQKIVALTAIDLDDFDTQVMLKYSFMIENFKERDSVINISL
ncbi:MAG: PucR family transcriptional regulator [Candidatus Scatomorpha sp.]|jgi:hypothetical protein